MVKDTGRKELSRDDYARRGAGVVAVVVLALVLVHLKTTGAFGGNPEVSAQLANAGGSLRKGSDVKVSGVIIGKVTSIDRGEAGGVRVDMAIQEEALGRVPSDVVARILPATVFGTSFVDLVSHAPSQDRGLQAGAVIAADRSQGTLELQQALDDIDRLTKALGPAELASAIGSAALALDGRGEQIGTSIDRASAYLARLNPRMPLLREDARKLAENMELVARVAPDLLQATEDGLVTLRTIATQEAAITALITGGTSLTRTAGAFLDGNQDQLVRYIDGAAMLLDAVYDNRRAGITDAITANIEIGDKLASAVERGYVHTDAILQTAIPPYYGPGDRPSFGRSSASSNRVAMSWMLAGGEGR